MAVGISSTDLFLTQILLILQQVMEGYRFSPTEEELVNYLKSNEPGCRESFCIIPTIENIYEINPSDLPAKFREKSIIRSEDREWWFICPQTQNQRISRKTPCGSWKITGAHKDVIIDGKKMGSKTTLVFPDGRGSKGGKSNWAIHEYRLLTEDLNGNYVLCHLKDKQDEKADKSTTTSEHEAIDGARLEELKSCLDQPDDDVSFTEHEIRAKMDSLMEPSQHQNRVRVSFHGLLQLLQRGLQSQIKSFPSTIHPFMNSGSPSVKDFSLDNGLPDISIELESLLGTTKEDDEWIDAMPNPDPIYAEVQKGEVPRLEKVQQETAARNVKPCMSLDEGAARAKNGQISITENHQSKIESLDDVFPLDEIEGIIQRIFNSPHFLEFSQFCASLDEAAAKAKGPGYEEHDLAGNSPMRRRLNVPENNQFQWLH